LPARLPIAKAVRREPDIIDALFTAVQTSPGYQLTISLPSQTVTTPDGTSFNFDIREGVIHVERKFSK
jgi:3-isopropylmalate dehydratase small subunit